MNTTNHRLLVAFGIAAALALPGSALARQGADDSTAPPAEHSGRLETYNLRGSVVSVDLTTDTVVVQVKKANHGRRGRAITGQNITVDLTGARLRVADSNSDGAQDINDVAAGDRVDVRIRLPRSQPVDLSQPVAAQRFEDRAARRSDDAANHS